MKLKPNFDLHDVCGEQVILAEGIENIDFSKIISLNDTAAHLWREAKRGPFTVEQLAQSLVSNYEVDEAIALSDTRAIVETWMNEGLIEP